MTRGEIVRVKPQNGGRACSVPKKETKSCNTEPCPRPGAFWMICFGMFRLFVIL
jgi:hypothetical protein